MGALVHPGNPQPYDRFGSSITTKGSHIFVGAPEAVVNGIDAGAVFVFDGTTGELVWTIENPVPAIGDDFGAAIALLGDKLFIGAPGDNLDSPWSLQAGSVTIKDNIGRVYVFDMNTSQLKQLLESPHPTTGGQFGTALTPLGSHLLVGAPGDPDGGLVYLFDGTTGALLREFFHPESQDGEAFGTSLAVLPNAFAVGDPGYQSGEGKVYVFDAAAGKQLAAIDSGLVPGSFGASIAGRNNRLLIGAPKLKSSGNPPPDSGAAYVHDLHTGQGFVIDNPNPPPATNHHTANFGASLTWIADRALIGAPHTGWAPDGVSRTHLYDLTESTSAERHTYFQTSTEDEVRTVAAMGPHVLISEQTSYDNAGAAFLYEGVELKEISQLSELRDLQWLSLSGNQIVDISPLANLPQLQFVYLHDNRIGDIEGLVGHHLIDNGDPGYTDGDPGYTDSDPQWLGNVNRVAGAFEGDYRFHPPGTANQAAKWTWATPDVPAGTYDLLVTWPEDVSRARDASYQLSEYYDESVTPSLLGDPIVVDQRLAPAGDVLGGRPWHHLATVVIDSGMVTLVEEGLPVDTLESGTLTVGLSASVNGLVAADAVMLRAVNLSVVGGTADAPPAALEKVSLEANPLDNRAHELYLPLLVDVGKTVSFDPNNPPVLPQLGPQSKRATDHIELDLLAGAGPAPTLSFDGTDDVVFLPTAVLDGQTSLTVEFWLNTTDTSSKSLISGEHSSQGNEFLFYFGSNNTASVFHVYTKGPRVSWNFEIPVADGQWHHFAVVRDTDQGTVTLYLDGLSLGTQAADSTVASSPLAVEGLVLGQDQDWVGGGFQSNQALNGQLAELVIWGETRTAAEIRRDRAGLFPVDDDALRAYWRFDEPGGLTVYDQSTNGYHGTLGNTTTGNPSSSRPVRITNEVLARTPAWFDADDDSLFYRGQLQDPNLIVRDTNYGPLSDVDGSIILSGPDLVIPADDSFQGTTSVTVTAVDGPTGPADWRGRSDTMTFDVSVDAGAIYGTSWNDQDGDGLRGALEPGVDGVKIFIDQDGDGHHDQDEPFTDLEPQNGQYDLSEWYEDTNANDMWDPAEPFTDLEPKNGSYDQAEPFEDTNGNHQYDLGESFGDMNENGMWDPAEPFTDLNENGSYDQAEPFEDANNNATHDLAEPFTDIDGDGKRDELEPFTYTDANGDYALRNLAANSSYLVTQEVQPQSVQTWPAEQTINGGFEAGDLTGWESLGTVTVETADIGLAPSEGTYQVRLDSQGGEWHDQIESFAGLSEQLFYSAGVYLEMISSVSGVKQRVSVEAGASLMFDGMFLTEIDASSWFEGFAFVAAIADFQNGPDQITILADANTPRPDTGPLPFVSHTDWQNHSLTFNEAGVYTISFGLMSGGQNSTLLVDNLQLIGGSFAQVVDIPSAGAITGVDFGQNSGNNAPVVEDQTFSLAENSTAGTVVATLPASDPDPGDTLVFEITGGSGVGLFALNDASGQITVIDSGALDFETTGLFTLDVQVTDSGNLSDTATITINLDDVNELPTLANLNATIPENSLIGTVVGTLQASDPDTGDTRQFDITGGTASGAFALDSASGVITVADAGPLDYESLTSFTLQVQLTDSGLLTAPASVTIGLTAVNETPSVDLLSFAIPEDSSGGHFVGEVPASDPDTGDTLIYAIIGGDGVGLFQIDPVNGRITVDAAAVFDFETTTGYSLVVQVTDSGNLSDTATITIALSDVNELPALDHLTATISENNVNGTVVGTLQASDPDTGDTLEFAITSGNESGAFALNPLSGMITVADAGPLDYESQTRFTLQVQVTDSGLLTAAATVTIDLTAVNETPAVGNQTFAIAENTGSGAIVGKVNASDPDFGDTLVFAITGGDGVGLFQLDVTSGQLTLALGAALDFETTTGYSLDVQVSDAGSLFDTATITIHVTNTNEPPTADDQVLLVPENSPVSTSVGRIRADDPDNADTLSYVVTGGSGSSVFALNPVSGVITVTDTAPLDFESASPFILDVQVSDAGQLSRSVTVTINVGDVNEPFTLYDQTLGVPDNGLNGTTVGTVVVSDPDVNEMFDFTFAEDPEIFLFAIDRQTGKITLADSSQLDETTSSWVVAVLATDSGDHQETANITIARLAPMPALQVNNVSVNEDTGTLDVPVTLDQAAGGRFSVDYTLATGTADASDYAPTGGTLTFAGTAGETQNISLQILADEILEADETFTVVLSNLVALDAGVDATRINATDSGSVMIIDDDVAVLRVPDVSVNEDTGTVDVPVTLEGAVQGGFSIDYALPGGTADSSDYTPSGGTLNFAGIAGETQIITVPISVDSSVEADEAFTVTLANVIPLAAGVDAAHIDTTDTATVTITNDDQGVLLVSVAEDEGTASVLITLGQAVDGGFSIDYTLPGGTADAGDYTPTGGTLNFTGTAGEQQAIHVPITVDEIVEADETFSVLLSNVVPADPGIDPLDVNATASVNVTIVNDDVAVLRVPDVVVDETAGTAEVAVTLDGAVQGGFSVNFSLPGGTADASDYTPTGGTLIFVGTVSETQTITIPISIDSNAEANETFTVTLSNLVPNGVGVDAANIDTTATGTVTIIDVPTSKSAVWDGDGAVGTVGNGTSWSDANNWSWPDGGVDDLAPNTGEPGDDLVFKSSPSVGTINLESSRTVNSLSFEAGYTLAGHTLTITSGNVAVDTQVGASIASDIVSPAGITKTAAGTLYVTGVTPAVEVAAGTFILGSTGSVNDLEIVAGAIAIVNGAVLGNLVNNGTLIPSGDLTGDSAVHADDIDALFSMLSATVLQADPRFDLVSDFVIDAQDVHRLVEEMMGKRWGDADLDGDVDLVDYHTVAAHFDPSGRSMDHGWARGDFDGDGDIDISDFKTTVMNYSPLKYALRPSLNSVEDKETVAAAAIMSVENEGGSIVNEQGQNGRRLGRRDAREWSETWSRRSDLLDELSEGMKD